MNNVTNNAFSNCLKDSKFLDWLDKGKYANIKQLFFKTIGILIILSLVVFATNFINTKSRDNINKYNEQHESKDRPFNFLTSIGIIKKQQDKLTTLNTIEKKTASKEVGYRKLLLGKNIEKDSNNILVKLTNIGKGWTGKQLMFLGLLLLSIFIATSEAFLFYFTDFITFLVESLITFIFIMILLFIFNVVFNLKDQGLIVLLQGFFQTKFGLILNNIAFWWAFMIQAILSFIFIINVKLSIIIVPILIYLNRNIFKFQPKTNRQNNISNNSNENKEGNLGNIWDNVDAYYDKQNKNK